MKNKSWSFILFLLLVVIIGPILGAPKKGGKKVPSDSPFVGDDLYPQPDNSFLVGSLKKGKPQPAGFGGQRGLSSNAAGGAPENEADEKYKPEEVEKEK